MEIRYGLLPKTLEVQKTKNKKRGVEVLDVREFSVGRCKFSTFFLMGQFPLGGSSHLVSG